MLCAVRYTLVGASDGLLAYARDLPDSWGQLLIVLNLGSESRVFSCGKLGARPSIVLATTLGRDGEESTDQVTVHGNEAVFLSISETSPRRLLS